MTDPVTSYLATFAAGFILEQHWVWVWYLDGLAAWLGMNIRDWIAERLD